MKKQADLSFGHVYSQTLEEIFYDGSKKSSRIGETTEIRNFTYKVSGCWNRRPIEEHFDHYPRALKVPNFKYGYAFADWVASGSDTMPKELVELNPFAAKFDAKQSDLSTFELPQNFSMFYGPRVKQQFDEVTRELNANNDTRRAWISILDGINDNKLLDPLRWGELPTVEYPCTIGFLFDVETIETPSRPDLADPLNEADTLKKLNLTVFMRSQNMVSVWPYDYMIAQKLLQEMAERLDMLVGDIHGMVASAHIYDRDYDYVKQLVSYLGE